MATDKIHIQKLCVGVESVEDLRQRMQVRASQGTDMVCAYTTYKPKQADALIQHGSLYWIIKGKMSARQKVIGFGEWIDDFGRVRTKILLDKTVIPTVPYACRPFQGWRYLKPNDTPEDLQHTNPNGIPSDMVYLFRDLGIL